jgi:hypothetical protein
MSDDLRMTISVAEASPVLKSSSQGEDGQDVTAREITPIGGRLCHSDL